MNGAREYAELFRLNTQIGRLAIVSGSHARGKTFHVYVLPEGEGAIWNGPGNAPLNDGGVEVYGVIGGQRGWTEHYGWLHRGPWESDFAKAVADRRAEVAEFNARVEEAADAKASRESARVAGLLATYR